MANPNTSQTCPLGVKPPDPTSIYTPSLSVTQKSAAQDPTSQNQNSNPWNGKSTIAAVMANSRPASQLPELTLANRQYGRKDGVPMITFSAAEYEAATKQWNHVIVAKFQIGRPSLPVVKKFAVDNWNLKGQVTVSANWDDRHVVFIPDSESDVTSALTCSFRKVGHCLFRLFRWKADYDLKKESTVITKWVRMPGLPMQFFNRAMVKAIVSSFATFLDIDDRTKALNSLPVCRACVELDITAPNPPRVWIQVPDTVGFFQDIVIEGSLSYCSKCNMHGHDRSTCSKLAKTKMTEKENIDEVPSDSKIVAPVDDPASKPKVVDPANKPKGDTWKLVTYKRKAIRHAPVPEGAGKAITVTSAGLINMQNSIDAIMGSAPFVPPTLPMCGSNDLAIVENESIQQSDGSLCASHDSLNKDIVQQSDTKVLGSKATYFREKLEALRKGPDRHSPSPLKRSTSMSALDIDQPMSASLAQIDAHNASVPNV